jgi:hypothetical protein
MRNNKLLFLIFLVSSLFLLNLTVLAQTEDDVVINEFTVNPTAGKEYVELLVTNPAGVNMQGWTLSDVGTRAGATGATEGDFTLPAVAAYLANVPTRTYVVLVLTTPAANTNTLAEDLDASDGTLVILTTTTGVVTGGTIDNATADNLQLYAGTRAAATLIDEVLVGGNTSYITGATWGDNSGATNTDNINGASAMPSNSVAQFIPPTGSTTDIQDNDTGTRWQVVATSYGTPGTTNLIPTAAPVSVGGQVRTSDGRGVSRVYVTLSGGSMSQPRIAITNPFGYYQFDNVTVGETYILSVSAKGYTFDNSTRVVTLVENLQNEDFIVSGGSLKGSR